VVKLDPNFDQALVNRGFVYAVKGDYELAIQDFDRAIALNSASAQALLNRGIVKLRKGDFMSGRADIAQAKLLDPGIHD
jgi:tetratricopeptide (TPR) repeat protein